MNTATTLDDMLLDLETAEALEYFRSFDGAPAHLARPVTIRGPAQW